MEGVAGCAAVFALDEGPNLLNGADYRMAKAVAGMIFRPEHVHAYLGRTYREAYGLCRHPLRKAILGVADRLRAAGTIDAAGCVALWKEVEPEYKFAVAQG